MFRQAQLAFVLVGAYGLVVAPAAADDAKICQERNLGNETSIAACTRLLPRLRGPTRANAYHWRGTHYSARGDDDRALADFNEAIRIYPKVGPYYNQRAAVYRRKGDHERAIGDYSQAIRVAPRDPVNYYERGVLYVRKGEPDRAIADLNEAIRLNPQDFHQYNARGYAHSLKEEHDRAITDHTEAIRLDPKNPNSYAFRGEAFRRKRDFAQAVKDIEKAIALDPTYPHAYTYLGLVYHDQGDLDRARTYYNKALSLPSKGVPEEHDVARQKLAAIAAAGAAPAKPPVDAVPSASAATPPAAPSLAPAATLVNPGRRVALVIGNGSYRHATQLANPVNDAADIAAALRKLGFEVVEGRDLDKRGTEDKLREFGRKLAGARLALFFYAGHGMQVAGKNYLVPVDAKLEQPGDLRLDTIDIGDVLAQMEAEPRVNLVFLDACRDNPLARSFARSLGARSTTVGQGLAMVQSAIGTMIAYATQPDAVALDGDGRNSPFTTALLKHIATPRLDIGNIMRRVRADVIAATSQRQVPWDHSSLVGDVVLVQ